MTDVLALELRRLAAEVAELRRAVERLVQQRDTLTPMQRSVFAAVQRLYAPGEAFCTSGLAEAARFDPEATAGLRQACNGDVQRLGILLRQVADSGAVVDGLRLQRLPAEAGARRWTLEAVDSL